VRLEPLYRLVFRYPGRVTALLHLTGRGSPDAEPAGRVVAAVTHVCADER